MIKIYNEDCFDTMTKMEEHSVDVILTSPFYNTNKKAGKNRTLLNSKAKSSDKYIRYDVHVDNMTNDEYNDFTEKLFKEFDRVLKPNGTILYNISYGSENTTGMFEAINRIISSTDFTIADVIVWKKKYALPNSTSRNHLTRIWEFVFVFCRKEEYYTYYANKRLSSERPNGQKMYENVFNYIEAKNNDGSCPYNKATYSTELCEKLLEIYAPLGCTVYDPFMGTGTTAVAVIHAGGGA